MVVRFVNVSDFNYFSGLNVTVIKHKLLNCTFLCRAYGTAGVIFFPTLVPGSGNFQLSRLAGFGYGLGLGFWVVITIIVSLTLTLTLITTLTVILR